LLRVLLAACPFCFLQYTALPACYNCSLFLLSRVHVGRCPSPTLCWSLLHSSRCYKPSPLQTHCAATSSPAACLFTVRVGIAPPPVSGAQGAMSSVLNVFFFSATCLLFRLVFFPLFYLGGDQSVQGAMLIYRVPLSSTGGLCLRKQSGSWRLVAREPSWFLRLMWSGDAVYGLEVWRSQSFASSWWFFLPGISAASLQDFTLGSMLSASSF
jgi:hypothetical protein